ncbi:MAG: ATP-dependent Clp protease ATP-binding subunit ClpX [Selenomonadaceae bacterium]|nr:ATP-dependent Clp protease ATP-binding subunit ClpX [Selenomonadaceae bacterium]
MRRLPKKIMCCSCHQMVPTEPQYNIPIYEETSGLAICRSCLKEIYHAIENLAAESGEPDAEAEIVQTSKNSASKAFDLDSMLANNKPHKIKEYLDEYIINQDRAKKILSVAVYNHYKRIKYARDQEQLKATEMKTKSAKQKIQDKPTDFEEIEKSNVIMIGPSGCGKTALLSHLSRLLDVPFAVTDASSLTEAGYVGADAEVAVRNLYYAADKDIARAERGIIYLDEFDKIARKSGINNSITADPGHEGVQQSLLKMIEGNMVEFTARGQRKHPDAPTIKMDTKNILFIVGGAFVGIEKEIQKRLQKNDATIGFGAKINSDEEREKYNKLIHETRPEDLMEYGILPEVIGRLPIICTLEELSEDDLLRILTEPKNAPVKQYKKLLSMDNVELEFDKDALLEVAKKAIERKTGARSLKGIIEDTMLDIMYELPKEDKKRKVRVTKECIEKKATPIITYVEE